MKTISLSPRKKKIIKESGRQPTLTMLTLPNVVKTDQEDYMAVDRMMYVRWSMLEMVRSVESISKGKVKVAHAQ